MKKKMILLSTILLSLGAFAACSNHSNSNNTGVVENYYTIDTSKIKTEILIGSTLEIKPEIYNLGDPCEVNYELQVTLDGEDVTESVYNPQTKIFTPQMIGDYDFLFTVLGDDGKPYTTAKGATFTKKITISVVIMSFEPVDNDGVDVSISQNGVITFGDSYSANGTIAVDSGQYRVTGVSFTGSYSITYEIKNFKRAPDYGDPSLYFGWNRQLTENNDDSIKVSADGRMATWIWGEPNLGVNKEQGWTMNDLKWWDAPGSVGSLNGDHEITFERYVNDELKKAVYGIKFDDQPYTYLDIGSAYTDYLKSVWVESVNCSCSISVKSFQENLIDKTAPTISFDAGEFEHYVDDEINLRAFTTINDNSDYKSVLVPHITVFDQNNIEQYVDEKGKFIPYATGVYKVVATTHDLAYNSASCEGNIEVKEAPDSNVVSFNDTSNVALPNMGIMLYATAEEYDVTYTVKQGNNDVTDDTIFTWKSEDETISRTYFKADAGDYILTATANDASHSSRNMTIEVNSNKTNIYGRQVFGTNYANRMVVGKDSETLFVNASADEGQSAKIGKDIPMAHDWTIEFDVTDMKFVNQGKLFLTKATQNNTNDWVGWEDIALGGKPGNDLWGFEADIIGSGWNTYQWRSNWQNPTTEFMPDPTNPTIGCGRGAGAYSQYGTGTHTYKIQCITDTDGNVTYNYYIDNQIEVVHHTADAHDWANGMDSYQLSAQYFNGLVHNVTIK